ncbi:MAG: CRISPR-associated endonuclease Cas1 [Verrucomicrobia bacterium]|nr:CRISPR-associated endonuclease Cas1 [Verrucomicrobiota bacterium]
MQPELPLEPFREAIRDVLARELGRPDLTVAVESSQPVAEVADIPPMPVRRLQNYVYCPRLFYYQWVENIFVENADTVEGSTVHRKADQPSRMVDAEAMDLPEGRALRSLQLENAEFGLVGKIDVLEGGEEGIELIDYKKGSARRDEKNQRVAKEADAMQIAAYEVLLTADLRTACIGKLHEARAVALSGQCPPPLKDDARCLYCSAYPVCLPNESAYWLHQEEKPTPAIQAPRPPGDAGEIVVVQTAGAMVGLRSGEVVVTNKSETLGKFPVEQVHAIYLYGAVQLTAQASVGLLERGVDVAYFSPAGRFLGLLRGLPESGVDARLGQYRLFGEPGMRLRLAREIIRAKIHNQRVLLMRNGSAPEDVIKKLARLRDSTADATGMQELLGTEGSAAALYFGAFNTMLRESWPFDFEKRNRRPPRDPVNALLSMGYSMMSKELAGVCHAVGLDPFLGFFHQPRYGRAALALDLMEEFRPLIADSVAISLINRGEIRESDFISSASGVFLNEQGRRAFWENYFRRMDSEVSHPVFDYKMTYRRMLEVQARQLWRFVRGEAESYTGFTTR